MRILASYNIKGGVGKTCTAVNLAYLSSRAGARTLLWDLDPQGAATYLFRVRPRVKGGGKSLIRGTRSAEDSIKGTDFDGLDLLPADFTYRNMDLVLAGNPRPAERIGELLATLAGEYDTVMLDCPPSLSLVSENVLHAADTLVVPLIPTTLSLRTLDQLNEFIAGFPGRRPEVVAFFSMVDRRRPLHRQVVAEVPARRPEICPVSIPATSLVEQMAVRRAPLGAYAPRTPVGRDYERLWEQVSTLQPGAPPVWRRPRVESGSTELSVGSRLSGRPVRSA